MRDTKIQTIAMSSVCLVMLLIVGAFLFDALRTESMAQSLPQLLGYATPAVVTILTAAKLGSAVDQVKTQVNGNYDKISARNRELAEQNRDLSTKLAAVTGNPDSGAIPAQPRPIAYSQQDGGGRHAR